MFRGCHLRLSLLSLVLPLGTTEKWYGSSFCTPFLQVFTYIHEISPRAFSRLNRCISFSFFLIIKILITFVAFCCTQHQHVHIFLCRGAWNWTQYSRGNLTGAEQRSIGSLALLAALLLMQPRLPSPSLQQGHMFSLVSTRTPRSFSFQLGGTQHVQVPWHPAVGYFGTVCVDCH